MGADADTENIREYARERLAGFESPKAVEFVEELPKTPTGKIQKFQLAEREAEYYRERDDKQAEGYSDFNATYWFVPT